jgi:hypothetical protein
MAFQTLKFHRWLEDVQVQALHPGWWFWGPGRQYQQTHSSNELVIFGMMFVGGIDASVVDAYSATFYASFTWVVYVLYENKLYATLWIVNHLTLWIMNHLLSRVS